MRLLPLHRLLSILLLEVSISGLSAQTTTSGGLAGVVTDPTPSPDFCLEGLSLPNRSVPIPRRDEGSPIERMSALVFHPTLTENLQARSAYGLTSVLPV